MIFLLTRTSQWNDNPATVEVNSLEELVKLSEKEGQLILQKSSCPEKAEWELEVYDDYRE